MQINKPTKFQRNQDLAWNDSQTIRKIGTLSVHVGSLSEVSQGTLKTQDPLHKHCYYAKQV